MNIEAAREHVLRAWEQRDLLREPEVKDAIRHVVEWLDRGEIRVAEPTDDGWQVN
ncbi:MAG: 2,3,4,5-tetrahydropyridine-2,6-dicarboxylate N-succinyltransferase, partial [Bacteroidota bacterium]